MVRLSATLPGDMLLDCSMLVEVRGTGTAWDQTYYPDALRARFRSTKAFA
jgi:uncharacterized protein (AIM24 family)